MIEAFFLQGISPGKWATFRWRMEIVSFLRAIWANDHKLASDKGVPFHTEISFGDVVLWWGTEVFVAYIQQGEVTAIEIPPQFKVAEVLQPSDSTAEIEAALIRFVYNNRVKAVVMRLGDGEVWLWKKKKRGDVGVWATGLPIGRPDSERDQSTAWLNDAIAMVFNLDAKGFKIRPDDQGHIFTIDCKESRDLRIPANISAKVINELFVMAGIALNYEYAPAAGVIEIGIKNVGRFRISIIARKVKLGYEIDATINTINS